MGKSNSSLKKSDPIPHKSSLSYYPILYAFSDLTNSLFIYNVRTKKLECIKDTDLFDNNSSRDLPEVANEKVYNIYCFKNKNREIILPRDLYTLARNAKNRKQIKLKKIIMYYGHTKLLAVRNFFYSLGNSNEKYDIANNKRYLIPQVDDVFDRQIKRVVVFNNRYIYAWCKTIHEVVPKIYVLDTLDEESGWKPVLNVPQICCKKIYAEHQYSNKEILFIGEHEIMRFNCTLARLNYVRVIEKNFESFKTRYQKMIIHKGNLMIFTVNSGIVNLEIFMPNEKKKLLENLAINHRFNSVVNFDEKFISWKIHGF